MYIYHKKNETVPFGATWMDREITILSEVRQRQIYDIAYMWNLVGGIKINFFTKQKQTHSIENKLWLLKGEMAGKDKLGVWNYIHTTRCKTDKQQGSTIQHGKLYSILSAL